MDIFSQLLLFLSIGAFAGLLAGFLGIGGGLIVVPLLFASLPHVGIEQSLVMKVAVGTSLATIIFTGIFSTIENQRKHRIVWPALFSLYPGLMIGSMLGAALSARLSLHVHSYLFGSFTMLLAMYIWFAQRLVHPVWDYTHSRGWLSLAGFLTASISSLIGIAGGTLFGPFLVWLGLEKRQSKGTSAACGMFIALFGTVAYVIAGVEQPNLPEYSLGYIFLPAFFGIIAASALSAPLGAKLAKHCPAIISSSVLGAALMLSALAIFSQAILIPK